MVQIRKEVTKGSWSIIAPTRSNRPFDFRSPSNQKDQKSEDCPFCPGNESKTPPEVYEIRETGTDNSSDWSVRVFPNKYSALDRDGNSSVIEDDFFPMIGSFGVHEVVVETPEHNATLAGLDPESLYQVLGTYRERIESLTKLREIKYVNVFRNRGKKAGASLRHPHSQIMATAFVPNLVKTEHCRAKDHYNRHGRCLYCSLIDRERQENKRVIFETERFIALSPFGSRLPFEAHILPKSHQETYLDITNDEIRGLAKTLKTTLKTLKAELGYFPYNYTIHTSNEDPDVSGKREKSFHWHLEILPRLNTLAGFEIGSGSFINIIKPEKATERLRAHIRD